MTRVKVECGCWLIPRPEHRTGEQLYHCGGGGVIEPEGSIDRSLLIRCEGGKAYCLRAQQSVIFVAEPVRLLR